MKIQPQIFIDNKNEDLWNILKKKYSIKLSYTWEPNYIIKIYPKKFLRKQKVVIYIQQDFISKEAFTHELLHLYLDYRNIKMYDILTREIYKYEFIYQILNNHLRNSISNFLDHTLFFDDYKKMGYSENKFITDFDVKKVDLIQIFTIENQFKSSDRIKDGIQNYIGTYFSIKCCLNSNINYEFELNYLQKIDTELYLVLQNFWSKWIQIKTQKDYKEIDFLLTNFVQGVKLICAEKTSPNIGFAKCGV